MIFQVAMVGSSLAWREADWSHWVQLEERSELQMRPEESKSWGVLAGLCAPRP